MPNVQLPDGRIVSGVPEETSKEELARKLLNSGEITRQQFEQMVPRVALDESLNTGERLLIGAGRGFTDFAEGIEQVGREVGDALGFDGNADEFTRRADQERELFDRGNLGAAGTIGRIGGNVAAAAVPGAGALRAGQAVARLSPALARMGQILNATARARAATTATASAAGGGLAFVPEGGSRTVQAGAGALGGLILSPLTRSLGRQLQKIPRKIGRLAQAGRRKKLALDTLKGQVPDDQAERIAQDIADGFTPEQAIAKWEIERIGAIPTRGRISGDAGDLAFEVRKGRADPSGNLAQEVENLQEAQQFNNRVILKRADELADRFAPKAESQPGISSRAARTALQEEKRRVKEEVVDPAFEQAGEKLAEFGDSVRITPNNIARVLEEQANNFTLQELSPVVNALRRTGIMQGNGQVSSVVQKGVKGVQFLDTKGNVLLDTSTLEKRVPKEFTAGRVEALRKSLTRLKPKNEGKTAKKQLLNALELDVKDTFGEDLFAAARQISKKEFFDKFVNPSRINAVINDEIPPERIAKQIQSSWSLDEVGDFFNVLDGVSPENAMKLRGAVMRDITRKIHGAAQDAEGLPQITGSQFLRNIEKLGDERLDTIFGKGVAKELKQFAQSVNRLTNVDRRAAGPNTANDLINALQGAGFALQSRSPVLGSIVISGSRLLGNAKMEEQVRRRAKRALNTVILQNDNIMSDIDAQAVSLAGSAAAGQQAAGAVDPIRNRAGEILSGNQ